MGKSTAALFAASMVVATSALGGAGQAHDVINCDSAGVCHGASGAKGYYPTARCFCRNFSTASYASSSSLKSLGKK